MYQAEEGFRDGEKADDQQTGYGGKTTGKMAHRGTHISSHGDVGSL